VTPFVVDRLLGERDDGSRRSHVPETRKERLERDDHATLGGGSRKPVRRNRAAHIVGEMLDRRVDGEHERSASTISDSAAHRHSPDEDAGRHGIVGAVPFADREQRRPLR